MAAICKLVLTMGQLYGSRWCIGATAAGGRRACYCPRRLLGADYERSSASEKTGMQLPLHPPYTMVLR